MFISKSLAITSGECLLSLCGQSFVFLSFVYNMKVEIYGTIFLPIVLHGIGVRRYYRLKVLKEYVNVTLYTLNVKNKTANVQKISLLLATPTSFSFGLLDRASL